MSEYRLKTGGMDKKVTSIYKNIENGVVGAYKKVEDAFVETFLEKMPSQECETDAECAEDIKADDRQ